MKVVRSIKVAMLAAAAASVLAGAFASEAAAAQAQTPAWHLDSLTQPGYLAPGQSGTVVVSATNLGGGDVNGSSATVTLRDQISNGLTATAATGKVGGLPGLFGLGAPVKCAVASGSLVECTFSGSLSPYEVLDVSITVNVAASAAASEVNEVSVSGGGAQNASLRRAVKVSSSPTPFGVADYELSPLREDGSADTQAGSHPFGLTTTLDLNRSASEPFQPAMPKDLHFELPPGLLGNPTVFPRCTDSQFNQHHDFITECPADTAIGVANITILEKFLGGVITITTPVFNMEPNPGEPARFGFVVLVDPITLETSVRTGSDYGVDVNVDNVVEISGLLSSEVTLWGVPGAASHDSARGWSCVNEGLYTLGLGAEGTPCEPSRESAPQPFLSMPTACSAALQTTVTADSWSTPGGFTAPVAGENEPSVLGCSRLPFEPSLSVAPDVGDGSTPTGLTVHVRTGQKAALNPEGLAPADVKDTTVTLPAGLALNPGGADGLAGCANEQIGYTGREASGTMLFSDALDTCPNESKIGTVKITTPLLPNPLEGAVYLASPDVNPFGSLVAMYIVAEDPVSGTLVKLPGEVSLDQATGQITATFQNTPQLPFEDLEMHFFGGSRAPLATPAACGTYETTGSFTPWSGDAAVQATSAFQITSGPNGGACAPSPLSFAPEFQTGTTNVQAGEFSELRTTMGHPDGDQQLGALKMTLPPGLMGTLSSVKLCEEPQAREGTCGSESLIGHTIVTAGVGSNPVVVKQPGNVYITGPYKGAPYGLSIVNPAEAGPFNLGDVVVRAKIEVNPKTAQLTITSDPLPTILQGIPLQLQHVAVEIDRPGFTFNPTSCAKMEIEGSMQGSEGTAAAISSPFQVANCARLPFKPGFRVSTEARTSRAGGASLRVKIAPPAEGPQNASGGSSSGGKPEEANIGSVRVELPRELPSRLSTLQKACTAQQFDANPADCPTTSRVGSAVAHTPVLDAPLSGPAYFVSNGSEAFPQLIIVLQGEGITVDLTGDTFISKQGITSSTFKEVPDVPVSSFELILPEGPYSALSANASLCAQPMTMPTEFTGQNGIQFKQNTAIEVEGCSDAIAISSHTIKQKTATVKLYVPAAGRVRVGGRGLKTKAKTAKGRETLTIDVGEKRAGRLHTTMLVSFTPTAGKLRKRQVKTLRLTFKK